MGCMSLKAGKTTAQVLREFFSAFCLSFSALSFLGLVSGYEEGAVLRLSDAFLLRYLLIKLLASLCLAFLLFCLSRRFPALLSWPPTAAFLSLSLLALSFSSLSLPLALTCFILSAVLLWTLREALKMKTPFLCQLSAFLSAGTTFFLGLEAFILFLKARQDQLPPLPPGTVVEDGEIFSWDISAFFLLYFLLLVSCFSVYFAAKGRKENGLLRGNSIRGAALLPWLLPLLAAFFQLFHMGRYMVAKVLMLRSPSYDLGLFSQVFHYMKTYGLPLSTLERDGLFSHFGVHFSPAIYLFLPFYCLYPHAETLQLLQLLSVLSGLIPLCLLCRHFDFSRWESALFMSLYTLQPGLVFSSWYDFHENCLLPPILLWLFWSLWTRRKMAVFVFSFLLLMVKEDAALYLVSLAIFWFFYREGSEEKEPLPENPSPPPPLKSGDPGTGQEKGRAFEHARVAALMISGAVLVFLLQTYFIQQAGGSLMSYRFEALSIFDAPSSLGIPLSFIANPTYFAALLAHPEKLNYILSFLLCMGFLPLLQRRKAAYWLFLPLFVMNLWSDYIYQYNIFFQYNYGSHVFLLLASMIAYRDIRREKGQQSPEQALVKKIFPLAKALSLMLLITAIFTSFMMDSFIFNALEDDLRSWKASEAEVLAIREVLDQLPRDRSMAATTFLTSALSDCDQLYDIEFNRSIAYGREVDYLIFDQRKSMYQDDENARAWQEAVRDWYLKHGYRPSEDYKAEGLFVLERESLEKAAGSSSSRQSSR